MEWLGTVLKFQQVFFFFSTGFDIALTHPCLKLNLVWCPPLPLGNCCVIWGKQALGVKPPPFRCWKLALSVQLPRVCWSESRVGEQRGQGGAAPPERNANCQWLWFTFLVLLNAALLLPEVWLHAVHFESMFLNVSLLQGDWGVFFFFLNWHEIYWCETEVTKWLLNLDIRYRQICYRHGYRLGIGRSVIFQI